MDSISGTSNMQAGSGNFVHIYHGESSGSPSKQQKRANQSPIPVHVDLRENITPSVREVIVPLKSKEQENVTRVPSPAIAVTIVPLMNKEQNPAIVAPKESTWARILTGNRSAGNGITLSYITPEIVEGNLVAKLEKTEIEQGNLKWKCALIVYILGEKPEYNYMKRYINQM